MRLSPRVIKEKQSAGLLSNPCIGLPQAESYMTIYVGSTSKDTDIRIDLYLTGKEDNIMKWGLESYKDAGFISQFLLSDDLDKVRKRLYRLFEGEKSGYVVYLAQPINQVLEKIRQGKFHECVICAESYIQWQHRDWLSRGKFGDVDLVSKKHWPKIEVYKGYAWPEGYQVTDDAYRIHEYSSPTNSPRQSH